VNLYTSDSGSTCIYFMAVDWWSCSLHCLCR